MPEFDYDAALAEPARPPVPVCAFCGSTNLWQVDGWTGGDRATAVCKCRACLTGRQEFVYVFSHAEHNGERIAGITDLTLRAVQERSCPSCLDGAVSPEAIQMAGWEPGFAGVRQECLNCDNAWSEVYRYAGI